MQTNFTVHGSRALLATVTPLAVKYTAQWVTGTQLTTLQTVALFLPGIGAWAGGCLIPDLKKRIITQCSCWLVTCALTIDVDNPGRATVEMRAAMISFAVYCLLERHILRAFTFEVVRRNPLHEEIPNLNQ